MRLKATLALLLFAASAGHSVAEVAQRFTMPATPYSVSLPGLPDCKETTEDTPVGPLQRHSCVYFDNELGGGYVLEYFSLPVTPAAGSEQAVLRGAAAGAAQATGSEIVRERELELAGHPAREVLLLTRGKGLLARVRYVLVKNDVVTLSVDGGRDIHSSPKAVEYLQSLEILADPQLDAPNNSFKPTR